MRIITTHVPQRFVEGLGDRAQDVLDSFVYNIGEAAEGALREVGQEMSDIYCIWDVYRGGSTAILIRGEIWGISSGTGQRVAEAIAAFERYPSELTVEKLKIAIYPGMSGGKAEVILADLIRNEQ